MADNTQLNSMTGGDVISTDDLTTLNSVAVTGQKVQRMKTGFGTDGVQTDVTSTTPLPVTDTGTDTINQQFIDNQPIKTTADGVQLNSLADEFGDPLNTTNKALHVKVDNATIPVIPSYTPDSTSTQIISGLGNSATIYLNGVGMLAVVVSGTFTATLTFEATINGTTWFIVAGTPYSSSTPPRPSTGTSASTTTTTGNFYFTASGWGGFRMRCTAYTSGQANIFIRTTSSTNSYSNPEIGVALATDPGAFSNIPAKISVSEVVGMDASSNLVVLRAGVSADGTALTGFLNNHSYLFNNANFDRVRSAINATNSIGTGIQAVGMLAQLDDTTPTAITENQFGNLRMTSRRSQLVRGEDQNSLTYSCSSGAIAPAVTATDIFTITGNATTTVFVTKVTVGGTQTTGGMTLVKLIKRSTANSAGTSTAGVNVPHDSSDAAASATTLVYTANPTTGTAVGTIRSQSVAFSAATGTTNNVMTFELGDKGRPVTLRGTAQVLAVNLNGVTVTGGSLNVDIEWYEV